MKNTNWFRALLLFFGSAMLAGLVSCHLLKSGGDKKMRLEISVSIPEIVRSLAVDKNDTLFCKTMKQAQQDQLRSSDDFIIIFAKTWQLFSPGKNFSRVFDFGPESKISEASTETQLTKELNKLVEKQIDGMMLTLEKRVKEMGVRLMSVQKTMKRGVIVLELSEVEYPKRVVYMIQFDGNLEFRETYEYSELYKCIEAADKKLALSKISNDSADFKKLKQYDAADTNEYGIANHSASFEFYALEHPLIAYLQPALIQDESGNYSTNKGPVVGYCRIADTARVNKILSMPEVRNEFPRLLRFAWTAFAVGDSNNNMQLIATKEDLYGGPALTGNNHILNAQANHGSGNSSEIDIEMDAEGALIWQRLTAKNIGKSIAIVLDGSVYSFPTVQDEIPGGRSSITGSFTPEEAQDMAWIFKSGGYPAHITIDKVTVYDKKGQPIAY